VKRETSPTIPALRAWSDAVVEVEPLAAAEARREPAIGRVAAAIRAAAREREEARRRRRAWSAALAVAAAAALAAGGWAFAHRAAPIDAAAAPATLRALAGGAARVHEGATTAIDDGATSVPLERGDELATSPRGDAELATRGGVRVHLGPAARLALPAAPLGKDEVVELRAGRAELEVPRLGPDRSFVVQTPDARVVVHGTAFTVDVRPAEEGGATRVEVREGLVGVVAATGYAAGTEVLLHPGESWTSSRSVVAPSPSATPAEARAAVAPAPPAVAPLAPPPPPIRLAAPVAADPASTLGEQNRLLSAAITARQRGDAAAALHAATELVSRFPFGALAPEAHVERFRALAMAGQRSAAAAEARRYLAAHRDGFARDEARALALDVPAR
jgi:hypothetical protein